MGHEQTQAHCYQCGRPTLHVRQKQDVHHGLHLAITLILCIFTCGIGGLVWVGIWLLDVALDPLRPGSAFRCTFCGQAMGAPTEVEIMEAQQQTYAAQAEAHIIGEERREVRRVARGAAWERVSGVGEWIGEQLGELPRRIDELLETIAGFDNTLLHNFLRVLFAAGLVAGMVAAAWLAVTLLGS